MAAAPTKEEARYAFILGGVPVGEVTLRWDHARGTFSYQSVHRYTAGAPRAAAQRAQHFTVTPQGALEEDGKVLPASLWLFHLPAPGCVSVVDELSATHGQACRSADAATGSSGWVKGQLLGEAFRARYADGVLDQLELPAATFLRERGAAAVGAPASAPGSSGFPVSGSGGWLELVGDEDDGGRGAFPAPARPAGPALKARAHAVHQRARSTPDARVASCVRLSLELLGELEKNGEKATAVFGLVEDHGRAFPHAWVRVGIGADAVDVDPTLELPVTAAHYLALGMSSTDQAPPRVGELYLSLIRGARRVHHSGRSQQFPSAGDH